MPSPGSFSLVERSLPSMISTDRRFWDKVLFSRTCWFWTASRYPNGYGQFRPLSSSGYAHRWIWETINGPIPDHLCIDHICNNRDCVNPSHLRLLTPAENASRGSLNAKKTHCPHGHPYSKENIYWHKREHGRYYSRRCVICMLDGQKKYEALRKQKRLKPCHS